jgi:SAM-dependent methyltransferase
VSKSNPTRGNGVLEGLLANLRARKANSFIKEKYRSGRILDIGCGTYPYFLINTDFKEKHGIDPSLKFSALGKENLSLQVLDITKNKLVFKDNYFDVITMLAVFEHIDASKMNFVLSEIKRVLKPNGILIMTTPPPWSDKLLHLMGKIGLISAEEIHEHKTHYSMGKIVDILKESGFKKNNVKSGYFELGFNMWFKYENK